MTSFFPKNPFSHVVTINLAKQKKTKKEDKTYQKLRIVCQSHGLLHPGTVH